MIALRLYLLLGLIGHKVIWEVLKRRDAGSAPSSQPTRSRFARAARVVKTLLLGGMLAQTLLPDVWPITSHPALLRAAGAVIFTVGWIVAVLGRVQLGSNWSDIEAPQIRRQQQVVANGIYRYIRHPIYTGDVLLVLGLELSLNSWLVVGVALLAALVVSRAVREERTLAYALPGYDAYCARTKRFVPYVV